MAALGVFVAVHQVAQREKRARLPQLPKLSGHPPAVADHLHTRLADAENNPTSAAAVGAFCIALHADMF